MSKCQLSQEWFLFPILNIRRASHVIVTECGLGLQCPLTFGIEPGSERRVEGNVIWTIDGGARG